MSEDELVKFEIKWKQIYSGGIEKLFRILEGEEINNINNKEFMTLYTYVIYNEVLLMIYVFLNPITYRRNVMKDYVK